MTTQEIIADTEETVRSLVEASGPLGLDIAQLEERQRLVLASVGDVQVIDGRARQTSHEDVLANHPLVEVLEANPFAPEQPSEVSGEEIRGLVQRGLILQSDGVLFSASALEQAAQKVAMLLEVSPRGVTVAQIRDALETTRKFALPIWSILDSNGITRRRGDLRIAGPRSPQL